MSDLHTLLVICVGCAIFAGVLLLCFRIAFGRRL